MSNLTPKQIDDRVTSSLAALHRAHERGDINAAQLELAMQDLARWSVEQYKKLPPAKAVDAIMGVLLGDRR